MLLPSVMDADPNASSVMYKMCSPGMYRNIYGVMRLVGLDMHQGMTSITIARGQLVACSQRWGCAVSTAFGVALRGPALR
jgi:hypothetical protein